MAMIEQQVEVGSSNGDAAAPHVLVFPFPAQGHINSMLRLAELLCLSGGIRVTFLNTHFNHARLQLSGDSTQLPMFHYRSISDGLPDDNPRSIGHVAELHRSLEAVGARELSEMLSESKDLHPITCIVADGIMMFVADIGAKLGIPVVAFRTVSACSFWAYWSVPDLFRAGELPFPEGGDLDEPIRSIRGTDGVLRRRDLPVAFRSRDLESTPFFKGLVNETRATPRASAFLLNTFESLEEPILSLIRADCAPLCTYTVGPLDAFLKEVNRSQIFRSINLREADRSCITWLDSQAPASVLYVSFGSFAVMSIEQLEEIWRGLLDSGCSFLWVLRSDSVEGGAELMEMVGRSATERGSLVVRWAPQEEVLHHPSVGGFFTHSGWNSTLESIVAGVPMLCWPFFADQQVNSRYVSEVWKVGLDIKDMWDCSAVKRAVSQLLQGDKAEELRARASAMAAMAKDSVREGGSSHSYLLRLVDDIKMMRLQPPPFSSICKE